MKEEREADFHAEFLVNTLAKIDWPAFTTAAESIGVDGLPSAPRRTRARTSRSCARSTTR